MIEIEPLAIAAIGEDKFFEMKGNEKCPGGIVGPGNSAVQCCVPKTCVVGKGSYGGIDGIPGVCSKDSYCDGYNVRSTECSSDGVSSCCIPKESLSNVGCLEQGSCVPTDDCDAPK
mmetsp:Transcript_35986/g.86631  ORF Transcript_35986/g.86631 Transcript_35986/m.86631 type:complete len:116 (+) Transcript_35986:506-853(+)